MWRWVRLEGEGGWKERTMGISRWRLVQEEEGDGYKKRAIGTGRWG